MTDLDVAVHRAPPADFVAFAGELRFGAGRARYRRANLAAQLERFADPRYLVAREAGRVVGGYAIDFRTVACRGALVPGAYRALLGTAPERRRAGVGRALRERAHALLERRAERLGEPVLSWGCIDAANAASLGLVGAGGARDVGGLATWLLYRQAPRETLELATIDARAPRAVRLGHARALEASRHDCALADATGPDPDAVGAPGVGTPGAGTPAGGGTVHAVLEGERIAIAARVSVTELAFDTLGPANDALVRRLVMPFGFARRRFDPRAFRYLGLADVVAVPDAERLWPRFVATLAARHGVHHALLALDPSREAWARLRRASGRRRRAAGDLRVLARWHGPGASAVPLPEDAPVALAPVDL